MFSYFPISYFHISFFGLKSLVSRTGSTSGSATENVLFVPLHCSYERAKIIVDYLCNAIFKYFCIYLACFFGRVFPTCGWRVAWPAPAPSPPPAAPVSPSPTLRNRGVLTYIFRIRIRVSRSGYSMTRKAKYELMSLHFLFLPRRLSGTGPVLLISFRSGSRGGVLGHQFNKRLESFAPCHSQSLLGGILKKTIPPVPGTLPWF